MASALLSMGSYRRHVASHATERADQSALSKKSAGENDRLKATEPFNGTRTDLTLRDLFAEVSLLVAMTLWMGIFLIATSILIVAVLHLPRSWAVATLTLMLIVTIVPVDENSKWGKNLARWIAGTVPAHFPIKVIVEDKDAIDPNRAHVIGFEPHSVWPLGVIAFGEGSDLVPFNRVRTLGSSALDYVPLCRHLWKWLGLAAVSRASFARLLSEGTSCVVIPGGVQECIHMNRKQEVLFLKRRLGFIRMALASGAPLVPAFCFGQRDTYQYWFPRGKWFHQLSRQLKFAPILYWGMWGGPLPLRRPMAVVLGKPIQVVQNPNPTQEDLTAVQGKFIAAMQQIYEKYKAELGAKEIELVIL